MTKVMKDDKELMTVVKYLANLSGKTTEEVCFIRDDARDALNAMPEGKNAAFYAWEVAACKLELAARLMNAADLTHEEINMIQVED